MRSCQCGFGLQSVVVAVSMCCLLKNIGRWKSDAERRRVENLPDSGRLETVRLTDNSSGDGRSRAASCWLRNAIAEFSTRQPTNWNPLWLWRVQRSMLSSRPTPSSDPGRPSPLRSSRARGRSSRDAPGPPSGRASRRCFRGSTTCRSYGQSFHEKGVPIRPRPACVVPRGCTNRRA